MNLDELIRTSVHDVAARSPVSSPDVSALRRRVRRTRLLQMLAITAAVAGVVAISAVVAGDVDGRRSTAPAATATATPPGETLMLTAYDLPPRGRILIGSAPGDLLSCDGRSGRCRVVASFEGVPQDLPVPVSPIT